MKIQRVKIDLPISMNTDDHEYSLLKTECTNNQNIIRTDAGIIRNHYRFAPELINDAYATVNGVEFFHRNIGSVVVAFIRTETEGIVGYFDVGDITFHTIVDGLNKYHTPCLVKYNDAIYIFHGIWLDPLFSIQKWNGESLSNTGIPASIVGCAHRNRLFFAVGGKLHWTDLNSEAGWRDNYMYFGLEDEPITDIISSDGRLYIFKNSELYELAYTRLEEESFAPSDATTRLLTDKAGTISHLTAQKHFGTIYFYNDKGAYILNPTSVGVTPNERMLQVSREIIKISDPVATLFGTYDFVPIISLPKLKRIRTAEPDSPYYWSETLNEYFYHWHWTHTANTEIKGGNRGGTCTGVGAYDHGHAIFLPRKRGEHEYFHWIWAEAWTGGENVDAHVRIAVNYHNGTGWQYIPFTYHGAWRIFSSPIPSEFAMSEYLWIKVVCDKGYSPKPRPFIHNLMLFTAPTNSSDFGSGFYRNRFYALGKDTDGNRLNLAFGKDGWFKYKELGRDMYNMIPATRWSEGKKLIGFGHAPGYPVGVLLFERLDILFWASDVELSTGPVNYDAPDLDKKIRTFWITYAATGEHDLLIEDEHGNIKTIHLDHTVGRVKTLEVNLNTVRSKWHKYTIDTTTDGQFLLRGFEADIKFFKPNE